MLNSRESVVLVLHKERLFRCQVHNIFLKKDGGVGFVLACTLYVYIECVDDANWAVTNERVEGVARKWSVGGRRTANLWEVW